MNMFHVFMVFSLKEILMFDFHQIDAIKCCDITSSIVLIVLFDAQNKECRELTVEYKEGVMS